MRRMRGILLWTGAVGWGVSVLGVLLPWSWVLPLLLSMGLEQPAGEPQVLQYYFRMATGGWTLVGGLFLAAALNPERYRTMIPLLGAGSVLMGAVLGVHGCFLKIPSFPFWGDVTFCLVVGAGVLLFTPEEERGPVGGRVLNLTGKVLCLLLAGSWGLEEEEKPTVRRQLLYYAVLAVVAVAAAAAIGWMVSAGGFRW